jgi:integrase/recombinase XerD
MTLAPLSSDSSDDNPTPPPIPVTVLAMAASPLDQNPAAVYLARLRASGRRAMHYALNTIAALASDGQLDALSFPWQQLRYQHTAALRTKLEEKYKPATANLMINALRMVLKEAWQLGLMEAEEYHRAANLRTVRADPLLRGRALKPGEIMALLRACEDDPSDLGARDGALICVLAGAGLRRSELVKLDLADYDPESGALTVRGGKGNKDRVTYLASGAGEALADWLMVRGSEAGPLFCPIRRGGHLQLEKRMVAQSVLDILATRAEEAGVAAFSPHDLRRTFISELLEAGADIAVAQKLAGHASVTTTTKYDRRGEVAKRKAVGLMHLPYQRRRQNLSDA